MQQEVLEALPVLALSEASMAHRCKYAAVSQTGTKELQ